MKAVVRPIDLPTEGRTLVVSDIHGKPDWLKALLQRASFGTGDTLVLLGDLIERGPDSLGALRYIMDLSTTHTVHAVAGNCDWLALALDPAMHFHEDGVWAYQRSHPESILHQMAAALGLPLRHREDLPALRSAIPTAFSRELDFIRALPVILDSRDYVFVHGGVPSYDKMETLNAWKCMKNDAFWQQGHSFPKYCVVGHWPVSHYCRDIPCCNPLVDRQRNIISIDGGCGLKADGQLNALILPPSPDGEFTWVSYDANPVCRALDAQPEGPPPVTICWTDHDVEVLEQGAEFCLCRHLSSGRTLRVLTKYVQTTGADTWCEDSTDYQLPVRADDLLSVVEQTSHGALVKKDGITGWYFGRLASIEADNAPIT